MKTKSIYIITILGETGRGRQRRLRTWPHPEWPRGHFKRGVTENNCNHQTISFSVFVKLFLKIAWLFLEDLESTKYCIQFRENAPIINHFITLVLNKRRIWRHWMLKICWQSCEGHFLPFCQYHNDITVIRKNSLKIYKHLLCVWVCAMFKKYG